MSSDEALYERLLQGELDAFDALYARYEAHLFGFILRHVGDRHEAEDVLHETFMALLRERGKVRSATSFRAWLFQVARNLCLNRLRSRRRAWQAMEKAARAPRDPGEQPEGVLMQRETTRLLETAIGRLPVPMAELYHLRAGGLSYQELAEVLDVPVGTVKSRMNKLVSLLREEMSQ